MCIRDRKQDELDTYVFDIAPKQIVGKKRYFQGRIWVDNHDFQVVETYGKTVPDIRKKKGQENLFPKFTTWREQIDGQYWFPTYTRAEDTLKFSMGDIKIREIVKLSLIHISAGRAEWLPDSRRPLAAVWLPTKWRAGFA